MQTFTFYCLSSYTTLTSCVAMTYLPCWQACQLCNLIQSESWCWVYQIEQCNPWNSRGHAKAENTLQTHWCMIFRAFHIYMPIFIWPCWTVYWNLTFVAHEFFLNLICLEYLDNISKIRIHFCRMSGVLTLIFWKLSLPQSTGYEVLPAVSSL